MVDFVVSHSFDFAGFALSALAMLAYQAYLRRRTRLDPATSALHGMHAARVAWVEGVMRERRDILVVQTLRNSLMTASFMASTSVLLIIGVLTLSAQGDKLSGTWHTLSGFGQDSSGIWLFKLLVMLFDLLFAFFAFSLSMRLYHHLGYMINVPPPCQIECAQPGHAAAELNRAAIYFRVGMRAYFFTVPLLLWLFGPLWMVGATALVIFFLYHLDRAPRADSDLMG
jgi:uncharacterized membrane protein